MHVAGLDEGGCVEVGDGACHFQDAVVGACGHVETGHGSLKDGQGFGDRTGVCGDVAGCHLGVAMDGGIGGEAVGLYGTGFVDTLPDGEGGFARVHGLQLLEGYRHDFNLNVDAVKQRTGDAAEVALHLQLCACAVFRRVVVVAARAWVHGCHKHESSRVIDGVFGTGDADVPVFKRLTEHFEDVAREFRKLVEEEDAVVCERDLSGDRV